MTFRDQANFMCECPSLSCRRKDILRSLTTVPISAAVIVVSISFAFWKFPRALFWSAYKMLETWLLVKSGAYYCWLAYGDSFKNLGSYYLLESLEKEVAEMKGEVRQKRRRDRVERMNATAKKYEREGDGQEDDEKPAVTAEQDPQEERVSESSTNNLGSIASWSRLYHRKKIPDASV